MEPFSRSLALAPVENEDVTLETAAALARARVSLAARVFRMRKFCASSA